MRAVNRVQDRCDNGYARGNSRRYMNAVDRDQRAVPQHALEASAEGGGATEPRQQANASPRSPAARMPSEHAGSVHHGNTLRSTKWCLARGVKEVEDVESRRVTLAQRT